MAFDVFLSYSSAQRGAVAPVADYLRQHRLSVFFDVEAIDAGDLYPSVLDKAVKSASIILAFWSKESFESRWCAAEWSVGLHRNVLLPVAIGRFERLDVPLEFFNTQWIDLTDAPNPIGSSNWIRVEGAVEKSIERPLRLQVRSAPTEAGSRLHRVPVAKDGSKFLPNLRTRTGFRIGAKGQEIVVPDYEDALRTLELMDAPYWRRPSLTSGTPGIVRGVDWEFVKA